MTDVTIAVPADAVRELEEAGLARPRRVFRGTVVDTVVTVGTDSATLVTLLQVPDVVRVFAAWIRDRCTRSGDSIELTAKRGDRRIRLKVDGDIDVRIVADFLAEALAEGDGDGSH